MHIQELSFIVKLRRGFALQCSSLYLGFLDIFRGVQSSTLSVGIATFGTMYNPNLPFELIWPHKSTIVKDAVVYWHNPSPFCFT